MKKEIVGSLILVFLATHGAAQTQPPSAPPQRTAPHPAAPSATPPTAAFYCLFEGKEYSLGALLCVARMLSQSCKASDSEHPRPWWSSDVDPHCAAVSSAPATVEAPYAGAPVRPPLPAQPSIPKDTPAEDLMASPKKLNQPSIPKNAP
jgi:hypothetical protein